MAKKRLVIYGGSFNPPGIHHRRIAEKLAEIFDIVVVVPCGLRPDKSSSDTVSNFHKKEMVKMAFSGIKNTGIDMHDLENDVYSRNYVLEYAYQYLYPDYEIWHFVGGDIVSGGRFGESQIQKEWYFGKFLWQNIKFVVLERSGYKVVDDDLPPNNMLIQIENLFGSSTIIRECIKKGELPAELLDSKILQYIKKCKLYL